MLVTSLAELRRAISTAKDGALIELAPGEYHGPIRIDRPITLRGKNRQTVLWRRSGPVLHIRAPGVRLERLLMERTVQPGPLIVHEVGFVPTGKESMELDANTLINLGELLPGSTVTLPIQIETEARTEIAVLGLYGVRVSPTVIESAGKHTIQITLDGKAVQRGEILLGEIALREGERTRYLWLTGSVLDTAPTVERAERLLCLTSKKIRLYPPAGGMWLESATLAALGLGTLPEGRYAYIQRDSSGALFAFVPDPPPAPITLDDEPLPPRTRRLLSERSALRLGTPVNAADRPGDDSVVRFTVELAEPPQVEIPTATLTFPDFTTAFPAPQPLTVRTLQNAWNGQVIAARRWLTVSPEGFMRVRAGRSFDWMIGLTEEALNLPNGLHEAYGALLVSGGSQVFCVDVRLQVERPGVALQVKPLDLGTFEFGRPADSAADVIIGNLGRADWTGELHADVPWLRVEAAALRGGTWAEAHASVRFAPDWKRDAEMLSEGTHEFADVLRVRGSFGVQPIPLRLTITPGRGYLQPVDAPLSFGEVEQGTPLPQAVLHVRNVGVAPWTGVVRSLSGWVQVEAEALHVLPGETAAIPVHLLALPVDQPLDQVLLLDTIEFEAGAGSAPVESNVPVHLTMVERPPYLVARPVNFPPFVRGEAPPDGVLTVQNMGPNRWQGRITSAYPWLSVPPRLYECAAGDSVDISIGLAGSALDTLKVGISRWENALRISGGREPVSAPVQIDLRDTPTELHLETPLLNFGQIGGDGGLDLPSETVRLLNASPNPWRGEIVLNLPWLSFERPMRRFTLEIPKMSVAEFKVAVNDRIHDLRPGVLHENGAISIISLNASVGVNGGGKGSSRNRGPVEAGENAPTMSVGAMLVMGETVPSLAVTPRALSLPDEAEGMVEVKNLGGRRWSLSVSAAKWLVATPGEFVLAPGASQQVSVRTQTGRPGLVGDFHDPRAVVVIGPGREISVEVEGRIKEPPPPPPAPVEAATEVHNAATPAEAPVEESAEETPPAPLAPDLPPDASPDAPAEVTDADA